MEQSTGHAVLGAHILAHIRGTAKRLARTGCIPDMNWEDIEQDLILDLWYRRCAFDPSRASFRTFADRIVVHRVATLASPTARIRAERRLAWLDAPTGDKDGSTLGDTIPEPCPVTDTGLGLAIDVRRFVAGLSPAMRRCCAILATSNVVDAARRAGLHRSCVYEGAARLRMLAAAAGLRAYVCSTPSHRPDSR